MEKMMHARAEVYRIAQAAHEATRRLRIASTEKKNEALDEIAQELEKHTEEILRANSIDMDRARIEGMNDGLLDRLMLSEERILDIAHAVRAVAGLPDPVGEIVQGHTCANGLRLKQVRVPMGVIGMIYEARPNVTVDAAALALKAGSAALLRGGHAARHSNEALVSVIRHSLEHVGLPGDLVACLDYLGREGAVELMHARGLVDVVIPRGGAGLIQMVVKEAHVPVIETGVGNVHIYIDRGADIEQALPIVLNSKLQRVGVCNAAEKLLVHQDIAPHVLPRILQEFAKAQVKVHGDTAVRDIARQHPHISQALTLLPATDEDWSTEYLAKEIAIKVVNSEQEALDHIARYSSGHTEAIISRDYAAIKRFESAVDCAAVIVNASTRFTDGGQFGMGAEIGISTQKLHARGPMGLREITTTTWIVEGNGHVRA